MALINVDRLAFYKAKDSGLRIEHKGKEKAICVMSQPGGKQDSSRSPTKRRQKHGWHSDDKKIEVATLYAATGSPKQVAKLTGVPEGTITRWMTEEWWLSTLMRIRREEISVTDQKFSQIIDKSLGKLMERIEGGDYVYDIKRGAAVPVPVSARDLAIVTGTIFDKRQLLRGEATAIKAASTSDETLKALAKQFEEFVKSKERKPIEAQTNYAEDVVSLPHSEAVPETPPESQT